MAGADGLRAVLIDIDGTLIDSNEAHARAWADILRPRGFEDVTWQRVVPLVGMGGDKLLPELTGLDAESKRAKQLFEERAAHFLSTYAPTLRVFPGARELLEALRARGLARVVATSAGEDELDALLGRAGIADLLTDVTGKDDAGGKSKPEPDVIEAALEKAGVSAREAVMLGDTPYDIEAAARAGVPTIAVRTGGWGDGPLGGAVAIYADVAELLANLDDALTLASRRVRAAG